MDALMQKKIAEAKQHVADGEKSMKTSLFKRKPDLDSAANSYSQAGSCFKVAKDLKNAIECCQKAADLYDKNNSGYNAAKQLEQAAFMANEMKNYNLVYESFAKACELLITHGVKDSAGILLERGANMLKLTDPEKALRLYKRAIHVAEVEEKQHEMFALYESSITISAKLGQYNETIEIVNEFFKLLEKIGSNEQIVKYILSVVLIYLSRDDWVSAKSYLDNMRIKFDTPGGFARVEDLIQAYDEKDDEKFKELIKSYLSYAIDNEFLKIANKIVKSDEWIKHVNEAKMQNSYKPAPPIINNNAANYENSSYTSPANTASGLSFDMTQVPDHKSTSPTVEDNEESYVGGNQDVDNNNKGVDDEDEFADGLL